MKGVKRRIHNRARDYYQRPDNALPSIANTMPLESMKPKMESKKEIGPRYAQRQAEKAVKKEAPARRTATTTNNNNNNSTTHQPLRDRHRTSRL